GAEASNPRTRFPARERRFGPRHPDSRCEKSGQVAGPPVANGPPRLCNVRGVPLYCAAVAAARAPQLDHRGARAAAPRAEVVPVATGLKFCKDRKSVV